MQRIARLERRMRQLTNLYRKSPSQVSEISAIEWAIPILEEYITRVYGEIPMRASWHKHEKRAIVEQLWQRDGHICYLCYKPMEFRIVTIDHEVPLSKEGKDDISNYKLVHPACNLEKGNMLLEVYREWQAGERKVTV